MQLAKILTRGQVTLPRGVRRAADLQAGDVVAFEVKGPGQVVLRALPRMRLAEALERYRIEGPIDEERDPEAWQERAARDVMGG